MKKKTYKQMQNRLYREIKRRMIAEFRNPPKPIKIISESYKIDKLRIRKIVDRLGYPEPEFIPLDINFYKRELVNELANKLFNEDYIKFNVNNADDYYMTVDAEICVGRKELN